MIEKISAEKWAIDLSKLVRAVFGAERFPLDIARIAQDYTNTKFPNEPIAFVKGDNFPGFEGGLSRLDNDKGWGIIYNNAIQSKGRIRFTIAHEFGHYLMHRKLYPNGLNCTTEKFFGERQELAEIEKEANQFAASILMPRDDFRNLIKGADKPTLEQLSYCANRYGTSLLATILHWLKYTSTRSMIVASRDDFILWSNSSESAFKSRIYYKTKGTSPIEIPQRSLLKIRTNNGKNNFVDHDSNVWFSEGCREYVLSSEDYELIFLCFIFQMWKIILQQRKSLLLIFMKR